MPLLFVKCAPVAKKYKLSVILSCFAVLYGFLIKTALYPELPSPSLPLILYSNQNRDDLRLVLKTSFSKASQSIDLWMYAATDPLLLQQLQRKALQDVHVTLRFDKRGGTPPLPLSLHPTPVKAKGLMHCKIVITDDNTVFIGSANMTTSSLQLHDNLSIGLYHSGVAHFLKSPSESTYSFQIDNSSMQGLIWLLPNLKALTAIEKKIDAACSSIFIAMFTLTQTHLVDALIRAHKRGICVTLALDRYTARGASKKAVKKLQDAGVTIYFSAGLPLLHHKWALIDQNHLILGSTNWTQAAFQKNDDILLFLDNLTKPLQKQLSSLVSVIKMESKAAI